MDCSMPGYPVLNYLPEFAQTHVYWVSDAIQPSHSLPPPSPSDLNLSQPQGLWQWVGSSYHVAKELGFSISPSNEYPWLISFIIDLFDLLAAQGNFKSFLQHHNSKASVLQCSAFFMIQLWYPYMTTGKTIALIIWIYVGKVMYLLFNMLSLSHIFFQRLSFYFMATVTSQSDCGGQENKICHCFQFFPSICHEMMVPDAMILVFECWVLTQLFHSPFSSSSRGSLVTHCFISLEWYHMTL